jgi:hypothetical protein
MPWGVLPSCWPSRGKLHFDPGISDRQLWAIGMVVVQWGMIEMMMHTHVLKLVGKGPLYEDYRKLPSFKHQREFWETQCKARILEEPVRTAIIQIITEVKRLKDERDRIMHGSCGGGMQAGSPGAGRIGEALDGKILPPFTTRGAPTWQINFKRIEKTANTMAHMNMVLSQVAFS